MHPKLQQIRKRLFEDFAFYAKSALKIRTKEGDIAPLSLNPAQQILQNAGGQTEARLQPGKQTIHCRFM